MARKKKPYRKVKDKNFLVISELPLMENKKLVFEWIKSSEVMIYVFHQARKWNFLISVNLADSSYVWQGVNYGVENRSINRDIKTAYGRKIFEALYKDEIDLMPPLHYRVPNENFSPMESEVIQFLTTKETILNLVFVTAAYNGLIIRNEDDSWIGIATLEGGKNG